MTEEQTEGVEILDPEMKKKHEEEQKRLQEKKEKMQEINGAVMAFINETTEKYGMKIQVMAYLQEEDELGIWKGKNLTQLDEMGFAKLIEGQF